MNQFNYSAALTAIRKVLIQNKQSLAVAESVTAGQLQTAFSFAEKAMEFFQGGITTYNIGQKARHLHVDPIHAATCNCVSEKVAAEMAINVCSMFSSDWGIAITGYASVVPEEQIFELFAYYAISFKGKPVAKGILKPGETSDPKIAREDYVFQLLQITAEKIAETLARPIKQDT
jgi:nicotinamide-nucleotide amidase